MTEASSVARHPARTAVVNRGTLVMKGRSSIHHNTAGGAGHLQSTGRADGAGVRNSGRLVMQDRSSIHDNVALRDCDEPGCPDTPPSKGGGVYNTGTVKMRGSSSIHENTVEGLGGGLYSSGGRLVGVMCGTQTVSNVYANTPDDCHIE